MSAPSFVVSRDGTRIAVESRGPTAAPTLVFVHGFAQSRRIWRSVLDGPLAADLHLVAFDLRGHGDSDVPDAGRAAGAWLGGDLAAVLSSIAAPQPPIVVAWSYGGVVLGEHLRAAGHPVGAILLVSASVKVGRAARTFFGPTMLDNARALLSDDAGVYEQAARRFIRGASAAPLDAGELEAAVVEMLRVPPQVRRAMLARDEDYEPELARCRVPIATLHGLADTVVLPAMSESVASAVPGAEGTNLDGVGHLPWLEAPAAFGAAVRGLVARARVRA